MMTNNYRISANRVGFWLSKNASPQPLLIEVSGRSRLDRHCQRLLDDLHIDGLKLDFLDRFAEVWDGHHDNSGGRDVASVNVAVARLIDELESALHQARPDCR